MATTYQKIVKAISGKPAYSSSELKGMSSSRTMGHHSRRVNVSKGRLEKLTKQINDYSSVKK